MEHTLCLKALKFLHSQSYFESIWYMTAFGVPQYHLNQNTTLNFDVTALFRFIDLQKKAR